MKQASYVAEPYVTGIAQMLEDIRNGHILIARFQRPLVWEMDAQIELLRSIRNGLPIGGILVWRTRGQLLPCHERIGRHVLRHHDPSSDANEQYVLDGFQRLSTLYSALHRDDAPDDDDVQSDDDDDGAEDVDGGQRSLRFYLDLDSGDFVGARTEKSEDRLLPLWVLMDRMELLRRERKFPKESWVETAEAMFVAFDRFKIPVSPLVTDDLELAIQAFERINSQGTKVGRLHAAHALSWSRGFDLLRETKALKEMFLGPIGWSRLDDDAVLEVCTLLLKLPLDGRQERVGKALREKPDTLKKAMAALQMAADFLRAQGIFYPHFVPYGRQIVLLAAALHPGRKSPSKGVLSSWLWLTTYAELFTGISGGRFQRVHDALQSTADTGRLTWSGWRPFQRRALGGRFDLRSARAKALALRLGARPLQVSPGEAPVDTERLQHENAVTEVLFRAVPRAQLSPRLYASAGNCFVVPPEHAAKFREELMQLMTDALDPAGEVMVSPEVERWLEGHAVTNRALEHLANGRLDAFVAQRETDLDALEDQWIQPYLAALDVDDEPD